MKNYNKETDKVKILPTTTVQFTVKGQYLPAEAKILKVIHSIKTYYPQIRMLQMFQNWAHKN